MAIEVGRQATIFRSARRVYIWLTSHSPSWYTNWHAEIREQWKLATAGDITQCLSSENKKGFRSLADHIQSFISDKWWTSTWTLQEAFLRKDAIFLAKDGSVLLIPGPDQEQDDSEPLTGLMESALVKNFLQESDSSETAELQLVRHTLSQMRERGQPASVLSLEWLQNFVIGVIKVINDNESCRKEAGELGIRDMADSSGISALFQDHPMALLAAARRRESEREEDKVYGIMQVFDLKLGKSRPGTSAGRQFSISDLEDELGQAIIQKHPVLSQMVVHAKSPPPSKAWRLDQWCEPVPVRIFDFDGLIYQRELETCCQLSTHKLDGVLVGAFSGLTSSLADFLLAWEARHAIWDNLALQLGVCLDEVETPRIHYQLDHRDGATESTRQLQKLKDDLPELRILLLGRLRGQYDGGATKLNLGLLLSPRNLSMRDVITGSQFYHRIGVCLWGGRWGTAKSDREVGAEQVLDGRVCWLPYQGFFG